MSSVLDTEFVNVRDERDEAHGLLHDALKALEAMQREGVMIVETLPKIREFLKSD